MEYDNSALSTHAEWTLLRVRRLREAIAEESADIHIHFESVAHALVEARPDVLREILEHCDLKSCAEFQNLFALAWRIAGNEHRDDKKFVERVYSSIYSICDVERATEAFAEDQ